MINKLKLKYYELLIHYFRLNTKAGIQEIDYGFYKVIKYNNISNRLDKIQKYTVKYNELYNSMYPEKVDIVCLESCGIPNFEKIISKYT